MPNTVGGISIATNQLANTALLNLNHNQATLGKLVSQLSSGLRVVTAADDPSGLAIAVNLNDQSAGFDTANLNVQDATNAANVADGALSTVTSILQRIRSLAIEAANTITSPTDRTALQDEVTQLLQEINQISSNTNFNGQALLDGSHAGFQPAVNATATITDNAQIGTFNTFVAGGGSSALVTSVSVSATSTSIVDGTIELEVAQINATQQGLVVSFFTSGTASYSQLATVYTLGTANTSFFFDGVTVNFNASAGTVDVNATSFIKVLQYVSVNSNPNGPAFQFQGGANEGATISVGLVSVSTSQLRVANINVATTQLVNGNPSTAGAVLGAQDAIGQIDQAITQVNGARAALGAVISRLQNAANNNNIASVNLTASASDITDLNVGQATADYNKEQILIQIGTTVLAQSNTNAQTVLGLFR
ncbi:MAG: flagellin [Candidatus Lustribacter sp.]|jgi:flagellin